MKSSVPIAFYIPPQVIDAISVALPESGLNIDFKTTLFESNIHISGFEEIHEKEQNTYDNCK